MSGRMVLVPFGVVFFLSSGLVVLYWRWHLRRLDDIRRARQALSEEAREMQRLLGEK
jgi:hypothetical protein